MEHQTKEFAGRMLRTVLFIFLVSGCSMAVALAGLKLASTFDLTTSREQVTLTELEILGESVPLPVRGKAEEGAGWTLRNSRGNYTLTLDGFLGESDDSRIPVIWVQGDLTLNLKEGTGSVLTAKGFAIEKGAGTLTVNGKGSLQIRADGCAVASRWRGESTEENQPSAIRLEGGILDWRGGEMGVCDHTVELAGSVGTIEGKEIGLIAERIKQEKRGSALQFQGETAAAAEFTEPEGQEGVLICQPAELLKERAAER